MKLSVAREQVLATCLELADLGYLAGTGGNVALRIDADRFAVTPSATDYYAMTPADVCVVRLADGAQVDGALQASVESGLHAEVLRRRSDCSASVHTHQPIASAYTLLSRPLPVRDYDRRQLLGPDVACVGYAPSGTARLARRVARVLQGGSEACLMRNHGVVCVGRDTDHAMRRVAALESEAAAFFSDCLARNGEHLAPPVRHLVTETLAQALHADQP